MSIKTNSLAAVISAVVLSMGAGCSVFSSDDTDDNRGGGISVEGLSRSNVVREGRGDLNYTAADDGTLYVMNADTEDVVFQRRVNRGQRIEVQPNADRISIDNDAVSSDDLKRDDAHRIYLVRDRSSDRADDRNTSSNAPKGVPSGAQLMGSGENKEISFSPSRDGTVYVYDVDNRRVVSRQNIGDGEQFVLSPGRGRATIDGKTVDADEFDTRTNYRVYFNRED
jgi:hypothetical protein